MTFFKKLGAVFQTPEASIAAFPAVSASHLLASLLTMAWFVEARDPYTGGHLWRVSRYARLLVEQTGADEATAARIGLGGFLHDLGKVGVPDAILRMMSTMSSRPTLQSACACWPGILWLHW
jgi:response regulator RpfG family c-di-GMP phosphodiesterase